MTILSRSVQSLSPSVFAELAPKIKALGDKLIPLHIGDTYRLPPQACLEAIQAIGQDGLQSTRYFKYTHPFGRPELLAAIVEKLAQDNSIETNTDCVQVTCGATQGLAAVAQTALDPGDEVIVLCPHWPLIRGIVKTIGGTVVDAPYAEAVADPETVLGPLVNARTKAVYFANPNNPDGRLLDSASARRIYEFCAAKDLLIWSDEAYEHLVYDGNEKVSIASLDQGEERPRVVSVFTFSKSFGMAGLRVGYVVGPKDFMGGLRRVSTHQIYDLSDVSQEACLAALRQPQKHYLDYLEAQRKSYTEARNLLHTAFPTSVKSPGGAYLFVPFTSKEAAWETLSSLLELGVSSAPGEAFGGLHPHCLRVCYTSVDLERLKEAVERIRAADLSLV